MASQFSLGSSPKDVTVGRAIGEEEGAVVGGGLVAGEMRLEVPGVQQSPSCRQESPRQQAAGVPMLRRL